MGLDKAIEHHKEHRKKYRGAKAVDPSCRNHGDCDYCKGNRTFNRMDYNWKKLMKDEEST